MNHPHAIEEEAFQFSRLYPDHNREARAMGHCCATSYRGGDCAHSMAGWEPEEEVETCPVDGRPLAPAR